MSLILLPFIVKEMDLWTGMEQWMSLAWVLARLLAVSHNVIVCKDTVTEGKVLRIER